eukprot:2612202-Rhodomonas_salina.1
MGVSARRRVSSSLFRVHVAVMVSVAWQHASLRQTEADVDRVPCRRTILASTRKHWLCRQLERQGPGRFVLTKTSPHFLDFERAGVIVGGGDGAR